MTQWKETLEPYVKVIESVKTSTLNPTAGNNLIIGTVLISDSGPSVPTLISSQKDFLSTFATEELTEDYVNSLNDLYTSDEGSSLASTMWLNAYRLCGSGNLLCCRASKASDLQYVKNLSSTDSASNYILRDSEILKRVNSFKFVLDKSSEGASDGWAVGISDIGIFGNRVSDSGIEYDYLTDNLPELVDKLNDSSKFFSPSYKFYSDIEGTIQVDPEVNPDSAITVIFEEAYLSHSIIDTAVLTSGYSYIVPLVPTATTLASPIDLNANLWSGFTTPISYGVNLYNSKKDLKVRIRRFNHNAVKALTLTDSEITNGNSPWTVLDNVLNVYTTDGTVTPSAANLYYDYYEVAVLEGGTEWALYNVGNITGRGDITAAELNTILSAIYLKLPVDLLDLGLNYYDYKTAGAPQILVNVGIPSDDSALLKVSDLDLMKAWDKIEQEERYVVEGLTDLGNTYSIIQNYIATMAVNSNYFYPVTTPFLSNYMSIANKVSKITKKSHKVYFLAPWDIDDSTVGFSFNYSSGCIYWETVFKNRSNNVEFQALFGSTNSIVNVVKLAKDFKKTERQLLLSKKVNTIFNDLFLGSMYINDNKTNEDEAVAGPLKEENNSRLQIRISKSMPILLNQFKGKSATTKTYDEARGVIDYWFRTTVANYGVGVYDYRIIIDDTNNSDIDRENNRMNVRVEVKYFNSIKYITVYSDSLSLTTAFTGQ